MFDKRNHGTTMRFFLWAAFYLNLSLFLISILWRMDFLMFISIIVSLLIIIIQKKHQVFSSVMQLFPSNRQSKISFIQYVTNLLGEKNNRIDYTNTEGILSSSLQFSSNPDFSKGEAVLHTNIPVKVDENKLRFFIGGSQCTKPYKDSILGIDIPEFSLMNLEMYKGLDLASQAGKFSVNIIENDLLKFSEGNCILKVSIDRHNGYNEPDKLYEFIKKIAFNNSVKGIEIVLFKIFPSFYSLSDMMDKKNNDHFSNPKEMLEFIQKIRCLSNGKPIGVRTGIRDKNEFLELSRAMSETGILPDFITVTGVESTDLSSDQYETIYHPQRAMTLEYAVSFAHTVLRRYKLDKSVKTWAAGKVDNGFDLLKLISLGADKCISVRSFSFFDQISDNYFFNDCETVVKSNILFTYRNTVRETIQIMEHAGFSFPAQVDPKMFFRRINKSTIKSFYEIYFKSGSNSNWGIFEDFIHLN